MSTKTETGSSLSLTTKDGRRLFIEPSVEADLPRYDFVDEDHAWHVTVSLEEPEQGDSRPELRVSAAEADLCNPNRRQGVQSCARIAIGLMTIDTGGRVLNGVVYDEDVSELGAEEIFPTVHEKGSHHYIGQAGLYGAIPPNFLVDAA